MDEQVRARQNLEELLEQAIAFLEEDPSFDLDSFLRKHPAVEDELRTRIEKLLRHGLLLRATRAQRVLQRLRERYVKVEGEAVLGGRHRLQEEIGRGGLSRVFCAFDTDLEREVAIKVIEPVGGAVSDAALDRFLAEAHVTGQLEHPGIVPIYDLGVTGKGRLYFAMKRVKGRTLRELIDDLNGDEPNARSEFPTQRLVQIAERISEALAYAHDRGVVHRDLKPANVMVGRFGEVQIVDWGLARLLDELNARDPVPANASPPRLENDIWGATRTGDVYGTPSYMAPEQAAGRVRDIDQRTDVFGVGALLYHLLSGNLPYWGATGDEVIARAMEGRLNDPRFERSLRAVPRELGAVCRKALARDKRDRYATVQALAEDLRSYDEERPGDAWQDPFSRRVVKWARRNPVHAVLALMLVVLASGARFAQVKAARSAQLEAQRNDDALRDGLVKLLRAIDVGPINHTDTARALVAAFRERGYSLEGGRSARAVSQELRRLNTPRGDHFEWTVAALHALDFHLTLDGWAHGALHLEGDRLDALESSRRETAESRAESDPKLCQLWARLQEIIAVTDEDAWRQDVKQRLSDYVQQGLDRFDPVLSSESLSMRSGLDLAWLGQWIRGIRGRHESNEILQLAVLRAPDTFRAQSYLAVDAYRAGDHEEAVFRGWIALAIDPSIPSASNNLCLFLRDFGDFEAAVEIGRRAIQFGPQNPTAYNNLALALIDRAQQEGASPQRYREAVQMLERAVQLDPSYANGWQNLAQAHYASGEYDSAVQAASRSIIEDPSKFNPRLIRAMAYDQAYGKARGTEASALDCLQMPEEPFLWCTAGSRMFELGQLERGYAHYFEALRLVREGSDRPLPPGPHPESIVREISPFLSLALGQVTPTDLDDWIGVASLAMRRHEFGRATEGYAVVFETLSESDEAMRALCSEVGVTPWRLYYDAARSAARSAAGLGHDFVPGVAWMEEADPALVDNRGATVRAERRPPSERAPWKDAPKITPERRAEDYTRSVVWLGRSLDHHWEDMESASPRLPLEQRRKHVSSWLEKPEFAATVKGTRSEDGEMLAEEVALFLESASELATR